MFFAMAGAFLLTALVASMLGMLGVANVVVGAAWILYVSGLLTMIVAIVRSRPR